MVASLLTWHMACTCSEWAVYKPATSPPGSLASAGAASLLMRADISHSAECFVAVSCFDNDAACSCSEFAKLRASACPQLPSEGRAGFEGHGISVEPSADRDSCGVS